jgi:hypothetical protein
MKLIFFLVAFCLISLRMYFSWSGKDRENRGISESNMVIESNNYYEKINYSGKFQLTEDETGFKSISPGGYFKFRRNEERVKAESNLKEEIEYTLFDGKNTLIMDDQGKKLLADAIKEMIAWGYDAQGRMERVYQGGGVKALLAEVDSMRISQTKLVYLNRLFSLMDSLTPGEQSLVVDKVKSLNSDMDERHLLEKIPLGLLKNPNISEAYFHVAGEINSDMDKAAVLNHFLDLDSITTENTFKLLRVSATMNSDIDKSGVYRKTIEKGIINGASYDILLGLVSEMNSAIDQSNLYKEIVGIGNISEVQWIDLINKISLLNSDLDKVNLLVEIAPKMPKTDVVKTNYQKAARTLNSDMDYGRVMRALE